MRIVNNNHIVLHKEAWEILDQAEKAGWEEAHIVEIENWKYPVIGLWRDGFDCPSLTVKTTPATWGFEQNYFDLHFSLDSQRVLSPSQLAKIIEVINGR